MIDYGYDIETYPNIFTLAAERIEDGARWFFEISERRNDLNAMLGFLRAVANTNGRMVGYNNLGFDYPIIHSFLIGKSTTHLHAYIMCQEIIGGDFGFGHQVWESDVIIPQLDLYKIHHFDNNARSTSLKMLEFNMRSPNIQDLPFPPGTELTYAKMDVLGTYNIHDVSETVAFYHHTKDMIRFREETSEKLGKNFLNFNDTKIGKQYFIMELERMAPGACYDHSSGKKQVRQTPRPQINLGDAVFPWIQFEQPEFQRITDWFRSQVITETKGIFKGVSAHVEGFNYVFGLGGIHGSVESQTIESDDQYVIIDLDVASYYPNLAIANRVYPAHLGDAFCDIYKDVYEQRKGYAKDTAENAMLKLALNGVYGDSNNQYSPFYDPLYTMTITLNGQLLLCKLAEQLIKIPNLQMIQANTDGVTVRVPRDRYVTLMNVTKEWEQWTNLELESVGYSRMFIRDVNNYIGEYPDGKLKRKGAYCHETKLTNPKTQDLDWHQNHSSLVVPKAAEAALVHGVPVEYFIHNHTDIFDFMLRTKVPRSSRLVLEDPRGVSDAERSLGIGVRNLQNITRFYVTTKDHGGSLIKIMPPLAKSSRMVNVFKQLSGEPYYAHDVEALNEAVRLGYTHVETVTHPGAERRIGICVGWNVHPCNDVMDATAPINYDYYIQEANKLVEPLR